MNSKTIACQYILSIFQDIPAGSYSLIHHSNCRKSHGAHLKNFLLSLSFLLVIMWNASFPSFARCYFLYLYYTTAAACPPLETLDNLFLENLTRKRAHAGTIYSLCALCDFMYFPNSLLSQSPAMFLFRLRLFCT